MSRYRDGSFIGCIIFLELFIAVGGLILTAIMWIFTHLYIIAPCIAICIGIGYVAYKKIKRDAFEEALGITLEDVEEYLMREYIDTEGENEARRRIKNEAKKIYKNLQKSYEDYEKKL